jgi:anthranilate synthase component 2
MILMIDNYDSFTWNLVQYLGELGAEVEVRRNDELSVAQLAALRPERVVVSPGPCTPTEAGVSVELIRELGAAVPILGVCLGHQAIGEAFGGRVVRAERVMHGKTSPVAHTGAGLFAGLPDRLTVARYHSLIVERDSLPASLEVCAWTAEAGWEHEIQALRHRELPIFGVQFHPESIASDSGRELIRNFLELAA